MAKMVGVANAAVGAASTLLTHLNTFDTHIKPTISTYLNNPVPPITNVAQNQLNPLIGAACAAGYAVYAAAKRAILSSVMQTPTISASAVMDPMKTAMNLEIDNMTNFAAYMYDNDTLLQLMKYSDQAQRFDPASLIPPQNLLDGANYFKKLSKQPEESLYAICGPVYFDYEWIFRQNPALIRHILGEDSANTGNPQWESRTDPLTEKKYYVHHGQTKKPKQRFDFPYEGAEEEYVSPEKASQELKNVATNIAAAAKFTADAINSITRMGGRVDSWLTDWNAGNIAAAAAALITNQVEAYYAWTKPGFYRYKMSQAVTIGTPAQPTTNTFTQLRPPTSKSYYNEPNLPTANPPPLMFVTPEMRTPENSFMIHTWLPDLSSANSPSYAMFVDSGGRLNKDKYRKHMYIHRKFFHKKNLQNNKMRKKESFRSIAWALAVKYPYREAALRGRDVAMLVL